MYDGLIWLCIPVYTTLNTQDPTVPHQSGPGGWTAQDPIVMQQFQRREVQGLSESYLGSTTGRA